jgi:acyl-CoA synthetase (AMP-forming)/AMP-acid ligase II
MTGIRARPDETDGPVSGGPYADLVRAAATARPDHPALVFPGTVLTYAELWERAARRAGQLQALGVGRGDTFGLMLPNSPQFVELFLGAARIGAVPVPVNTRYKTFEVAHVCRDGELRALFTTSQVAEHLPLGRVVTEALDGLQDADPTMPLSLEGFPHLRHVAMLGPTADAGMVGEAALDRLASDIPHAGPAVPAPEAPVMIMYTSGTTSLAKGCVFTNDALTANAAGTAERFEMTPDDRCWCPLPMFHVGALLFMAAIFTRGGTFISQEHFDAAEALALCTEHRPTLLYPLFPTITLTFIQHPDFQAYDRRDVRAVCNVSPESTQAQVQEVLAPAVLVNAYGMTEVCGTLSYSRLDESYESRMRSCGPALPGWEVAIVDPETGERVPPRTEGELIPRGRSLFSGYYKHPEQTAACHDDQGFFRTGDRCSLDENGLLYFHGRSRDVLKVGGENVSALEVEAYLETHPSIKLCQIVGIPDDRLIEVPVAFIELARGASLGEGDVIAYCRGTIASFKIPRHVRFVTEWPMSSTKIQKFRLREQILKELGIG